MANPLEIDNEHDRVLNELIDIEETIEELTSLRSNWNQQLLLETIEGERGSKSFACDITLRRELASSPLPWRTMIHEMFHACSVGFNIHDYNAARGWEEGVVEPLSR